MVSPVHTLGLIKPSSIVYLVERHKYHDSTNLPLMVSLVFVLQDLGNTIDDADYIIHWIFFIIILYVTNSCHSHSIVNDPSSLFNINGLLVSVGGNTMKNTLFKKSCQLPEKIANWTLPHSNSFAHLPGLDFQCIPRSFGCFLQNSCHRDIGHARKSGDSIPNCVEQTG